jgi:hypothetical protein
VDKWKNIFKSWSGVLVLILVALAVVWLFTNGLPGYKSWQIKRAYEKMNEPYYNDTYGGKTPEETYDLFIDALKKGDVELASKYFVVEKQDDWLETLRKFEETGELTGLINELEYGKTVWKKVDTNKDDVVSFQYDTTLNKDSVIEYEGQKLEFPADTYTNSTEFQKYPSGVWKIEGI